MITSLLDNDYYAFTMGQFIWKNYPDTVVRYEFRNRSFSVPLARHIDLRELQHRIDTFRKTSFSWNDAQYITSIGLRKDYAHHLYEEGLRLPEVEISERNGHLVLEYEGLWQNAVFMETPVLAIVNELYFEQFGKAHHYGAERLTAKIEYLRSEPNLQFMEFGTRRRFSASWQKAVLEALLSRPTREQVVGTSNVALAREFGIEPKGTMAHQLFMVLGALTVGEPTEDTEAQNEAMKRFMAGHSWLLAQWQDMYHLGVLLPDTYTTKWFLENMNPVHWPGLRQDSGDPFAMGDLIKNFWFNQPGCGEDRTLIPSDGLDLRTMSLLMDRFASKVNVLFGWGTDLTNDLGYEQLGIVIKPKSAEVDGKHIGCVKLSDDPAKATGTRENIAYYRKLLKV